MNATGPHGDVVEIAAKSPDPSRAATIANALPNLVPSPAGENLPRIALPSLGLLALCAFSFGMLIVESAAMDWSSPFMRNVLGISPFATGFGFGAFTVFMAGGRLLGDRLAERFGPVALARTCCVICLGGMVALVTAAGLVQAAVGLALTGLGISVAVPLAVSAAAGRGDRPAAEAAIEAAATALTPSTRATSSMSTGARESVR